MATKAKPKKEPKPPREFQPGLINDNCPFKDSSCWMDFECVGCSYEALVARDAPIHVGLWNGYIHRGKPIKLAAPPLTIAQPKAAEPKIEVGVENLEANPLTAGAKGGSIPSSVTTPTSSPKPQVDGNIIRRLASGTLVEVTPQGRVVRTIEQEK